MLGVGSGSSPPPQSLRGCVRGNGDVWFRTWERQAAAGVDPDDPPLQVRLYLPGDGNHETYVVP